MAGAPLLSAEGLIKQYGSEPLFEGVSLALSEGERVSLIGPNGAGKSTLMRILCGEETPDKGAVRRRNSLRAVYVPQSEKFDEDSTVGEVLSRALEKWGFSESALEAKISVELGRSGFLSRNQRVSELSGGWRKRLALVAGLAVEPELLLLDEPTNHLDIHGILWLEKLLLNTKCGVLFVSHDRYFIERLATRVVEINPIYPNGTFGSEGRYSDFLEKREDYLASLRQARRALAGRVRREVEWLRQGAKARTTKSKHRTAEAHAMVDQLKGINLEEKRVNLEFAASRRKTKDLLVLEEVKKSYEEKTLFQGVTLTLSPGMRLGVIGPNGAGKTTFMKILLGEVAPDRGTVVRAPNLRVSYFDQARKQLDPTITLRRALCPEGDTVIFEDRPLHVAAWASRFLFDGEQLNQEVGALSGGEQARLLLARLMLESSDVLLFDEPTNDLDILTLEVLEESFESFPGAIVLVTHDRYLLERVSTSVLAIEGSESAIYGDYLQWEALQGEREERSVSKAKPVEGKGEARKKLAPDEHRELSQMERKITTAEAKVQKIQDEMNSEHLATNTAELSALCEKLAKAQSEVDALYARWEELEAKRG